MTPKQRYKLEFIFGAISWARALLAVLFVVAHILGVVG